MKIASGNDFTREMTEISKVANLNEAMDKQLQLDDPIGKRITNSVNTFTIISVVKDFHFESLKQNIRGVCLTLGGSSNIVSVKISGADVSNSLQSIKKVWNKFSVTKPFRYTFLDENFATMYSDVQGSIIQTSFFEFFGHGLNIINAANLGK